jgi:cysteine-rich repeat protein
MMCLKMKNQLSFLISILLWLIPIHSVNAQGICGNRVVEGREECDDGNLFHCDGCSANCQKSPNLEMKSLIENLSFELGSKQTNISMPIRKIDFKTGFQFAQREVTVADYKYCQAQGGCSSIKPSLPNQLSCTYKGDFRRYQNLQQYDINQMPSDDQIPLNCITWQEAQQFAKWCSSAQSNDAIKASLPTEAQFEFVAKNSGKNIEYANHTCQLKKKSIGMIDSINI